MVAQPEAEKPARPYAYYVLILLTFANFLNYVDRNMVGILGQSIKTDLKLNDAQLGFLLGTAFATLYGVTGIALGRISDAMNRARLMSFGLFLWSGMTMLAGLVTGFPALGLTRVGVGVGEATANPCSHSLIAQYFPVRNRATAMGFYLTAIYVGAAGALVMGGLVLQNWHSLCHVVPFAGACGIKNWRAAFLVVGLPGVLLSLLIFFMREPVKRAPVQGLGRLVAKEFSAAIPPFTLINLAQVGGARAVVWNLALIVALAVGATGLTILTHDIAQWVAVAIAAYSVITWAQVLRLRDLPLFKLTLGCPTFAWATGSGALLACVTGTTGNWAAPFAIRYLHVSPGQAGVSMGFALAVSAGLSVFLGGMITDFWKKYDRRAPIWVGLSALILPLPGLALMMTAKAFPVFLAGYFFFSLFATGYAGAYAALTQDLVLPRMRGTAAAAFSLVLIVVAGAIGPYWAGKISVLTNSLRVGLISLQVLAPFAAASLLYAAHLLKKETHETRRARAAAFGELDMDTLPIAELGASVP